MKKQEKQAKSSNIKIAVITSASVLAVSLIVAFLSFETAASDSKRAAVQASETKLSLLGSSLDAGIDNVESFVNACQGSRQVTDFLMEVGGTKAKSEATEFVKSAYSTNTALRSELVRMVIVSDERPDFIQIAESPYSTSNVTGESVINSELFKQLIASPGILSAGVVDDPFLAPLKPVPVIPYAFPISNPYSSGIIGYVLVELSPSAVAESFNNYRLSENGSLYISICDYLYLYKDNALVYVDTRSPRTPVTDVAVMNDTQIAKLRTDNGNAILVSRPLVTKDCFVIELLNEKSIIQGISARFRYTLVFIIVLAVVVSFLLSFIIIKTVNRRLLLEQEKKAYEYRFLQSQIHPHFLYNTLNSIKWMALNAGCNDIAQMTTALGRLLRSTAKASAEPITLSEELLLTEDYFTVQRYRQGDSIHLTIDAKDKALCEHTKIPRLTLQPILENAIFHGLEPQDGGGVVVKVTEIANDVQITVTDNGIGMDEA